ncbi:MAG TPA: hypothetical protein VE974_06210 [Thermoanaerobaculia bacterium]|nr:hypothetical protein [Thermoanaerobaculia bacterium]
MDTVKPSLAKNATVEQKRAYFRRYRRRNLQHLREYRKLKQREYRARDRELKAKAAA